MSEPASPRDSARPESIGKPRSTSRRSSTPEETRGAKYDFAAIDLESGSTHADVVMLVGENRRVLELGPATGYMTRTFVERGCTVVGIEVDAEMAERAAQHAERVIVGDLDTLELDAELADARFDVIVAADVLEHLKDPLAVLTRLRAFLAPDGFFVLSLPNIAHGSVRLALLSGEFSYRDIGLLDRTHLRFFTRETLEQLLNDADLGMAVLHRHELQIDASEVPFDDRRVPQELREALDRDPEALTYQFVVKAIPMAGEGLRELQRQIRELANARDALERELAVVRAEAARVDELNAALAAISGREGELRRALIEAHDQLLRRDAEIDELRSELDEQRHLAHEQYANARRNGEELEAARRELRGLRVRLDRILQSPPLRAYQRAQHLPGVRQLKRRREAGYLAEVARRSGPNG